MIWLGLKRDLSLSLSLITERITSKQSNIFADNCGASLTHGTSWYSLKNTSHSPQTIFNKNNVFKNCTTARFICNQCIIKSSQRQETRLINKIFLKLYMAWWPGVYSNINRNQQFSYQEANCQRSQTTCLTCIWHDGQRYSNINRN